MTQNIKKYEMIMESKLSINYLDKGKVNEK